MQNAYGILDHPDIPIFAVDAAWPSSKMAAKPAELMQRLLQNRERCDFPHLIAYLSAPRTDSRTLIAQICITQMVRGLFVHMICPQARCSEANGFFCCVCTSFRIL